MSLRTALSHLENYIRQRLGQSRLNSGERLSRQSSQADADIERVLPPELLLHIFAFLDAKDLCRCACVSRHFELISSDELLWNYTLNRDAPTWDRLERDRNPDALLADGSLGNKEIYLRCCPLLQQNSQSAWNLDSIRQFFSKRLRRRPRLALLGPGIENKRTSKFVRSLVHNQLGQEFEPVNMINGVDGVGSGITYRMTAQQGTYMFDLLTLYSSRREDRERHTSELDRVRGSVLLKSSQQEYEVIDTVRRLELDALIYAVDAEASEEETRVSRLEMDAFVRSMQPTQPLLVLALAGSPDSKRAVTCRQVARALQLESVPNPWCVRESNSKQLTSLSESLVWLLGQA